MLVVVALLTVAATAVGQNLSGCRLCDPNCLTIPRSDGSCPICICGGVALADCSLDPLECQVGCQEQRGENGCLECYCPPVVCPQLPPCDEDCVQLDEDGCPACTCEEPEGICPAFSCAEGCTTEIAEDGCPVCRCAREGVCPSIPECLRGCLDLNDPSGCYSCNCSLVPDPVFRPRPASFDQETSLEIPLPVEVPNPVAVADGVPTPRCRNNEPRLQCRPGCRVAVSDVTGCRECYCDDDAFLCPGVPSCANRCQFLSSEDRCCRCGCGGGEEGSGGVTPFTSSGEWSSGGISITISGVPVRPPIRPEIPGLPRLPPAIIPALEPPIDTGIDQGCQQEPTTCDDACEDTQDSRGCRLCVCPGDLCPRIRCPEACVQGVDDGGCPLCNCGGGEAPQNDVPDSVPIDTLDIPNNVPDEANDTPAVPDPAEPADPPQSEEDPLAGA